MNNIIAIIPARSGSKGVKDKNIRKIAGKTLIHYAVKVALASDKISGTYISTDSKLYEKIAIECGVDSLGLRSKELSGDYASSVDVVIDFVKQLPNKPDIIVLLQPTSPVRTTAQVNECLKLLESSSVTNAVISIARFEEPHPHKLKKIDSQGHLVSFIENADSSTPRQKLPHLYQLTGSIYAIKTEALLKYRTFNPPGTLPYEVDCFANIDSEDDILFLKYMVENGKINLPD